MSPGLRSFLLGYGFTLDENGRAVPLPPLSPVERFALDAARMTELRTRQEGPSPKSARRREKRARAAACKSPRG